MQPTPLQPGAPMRAIALPPACRPVPGAGTAPARQRSTHAFLHEPLTLQQTSQLLWLALGGRCPDSWGRHAPPGPDAGGVTLYAVLPQGAFRYDPARHQLQAIGLPQQAPGVDLGELAPCAPLHLIYVVDAAHACWPEDEERGASGAPAVEDMVANVYRYCAHAGLGTTVHGVADRGRLVRALRLAPSQRIALAQAVGHPRPLH